MQNVNTSTKHKLSTLLLFLFFTTTLSALDYYWVNGSGAWSAYATHWAKIPNPTLPAHYHANVPTADDDVYFGDTNGGAAYTVTVDAGSTVPKCRNMDWTGVPAGTVWGGGGGTIDIYGSIMLDANMSMTFSGVVQFNANGITSSIFSDGVHFSTAVYFQGTSGGWQLMDPLFCKSVVQHFGGLLETMNHSVTIEDAFYGHDNAGILHLGTSTLKMINGWAYFYYPPAQFVGANSKIELYSDNGVRGAWYHPTAVTIGSLEAFSTAYLAKMEFVNSAGTVRFHGDAYLRSDFDIAPVPVHHNVIFEKSARIDNANNFENLTFSSGQTYVIGQYQNSPGTDQTILPGGSLTALGAGTCSQFITIKSGQYGTHFNFVNNSGAQQTVHCAILEDCHATGSDPLEVIDGVNLGNNPGWIFTAPNPGLDLYWIGGAGDWNDPNHWSETDGGTAGICIPNGGSNVHFTTLSGFSPGDQVTVSVDVYCKNMDWTGVTGEPTFLLPSGTYLHIYDSLTLATPAEMTFQNDNDIRLRGSTVHTITCAGQVLHRNAIFEGPGLYKFADAFNSLTHIIHLRGQIKTMGHPVTILGWHGNYNPYTDQPGDYSAEAWLGDPDLNISSTITLQDNATYLANFSEFRNEYAAGKFHAMQSEIISASGGIDAVRTIYSPAIHDYWRVTFPTEGTFQRGNVLDRLYFGLNAQLNQVGDFHEVFFNSTANILGSHRYDILSIHGTHGYNIESGTVQTITTGGALNVLGATCQGMAYLFTQNPTQTAKIAMESGHLNLDRVILDNIHPDLTTGATYSATNSVGIQPQVAADWNLTNPPARDLYWVGGGGDWQDGSHWSLSSGGTPGECPPTPVDDVFFDAASGLVAGEEVTPTQFWQFCKDMDWTGVNGGKLLFGPVLYTPNNIQVFGSLTFSPGMVNEFHGPFWLRANGPATITSNGVSFRNDLNFRSLGGEYSLNDGLQVDVSLIHSYGTLRTNDQPINVGFWFIGGVYAEPNDAEIFLGSSTVRLMGTVYNANSLNYSFAALWYSVGKIHCGTSHFIFEGPGLSYLYSNAYNNELYDVTFKSLYAGVWGSKIKNKMIFEHDGGIDYANGDNFIHEVDFRGDAYLSDTRPYHKMTFAPGKRYTFGGGYNPFGGPYTTTLVPHAGIEGQFIAQGLPGQYIEMKSSDPNTPAIIHKDDYDGTSTCTKYLFLTGMTHTGTEDIYVPTPGGDVFNNTGWLFFPCNPCPATIPVLDAAASITTGCPPGTAKLVLAGLKPDEWANWYTDPAATTNLVYSGGTPGPAGNMFQPAINGPVTYYARVYSDGGLCESTVVLAVDITITNPPAAFNVTGGGLVCAGSNGTPVGLDGSVTGVSYQLQLDGSDLGSPLAGTGAALNFGLQTAAGTYTVVANTDGTSCPATMTGSAIVTGSPNQAPVVVASGNSPLCTPADLYLVEYGGAAVTWNWTGPGGFASSDQNPVLANVTPANSGTYTVVVSDGLGCTNIGSVGVAVSIPETAYCPTDTSLCIDFGLFDLSWGGWPPGGTFSGPGVSQNQFDPAVAGPGVHVLSYSVYDPNNCPVSCTFNYTVFDLPAMTCPGDSTICLGFSTPFALTGGSPANGTYSGPGVTAGEFDASAAGIGQHLITYTAYAYGCANTCTFTYTVVGDQTPTLTVNPPVATLYVNCYPGPPPPDAVAFDYLGNPLAYSLTEVISPGACPQEMALVRTYTAEDPNATCNTSTQFVQTIYVQDTQGPVLSGLADVTISSADPLPTPTVSAQDGCDPSPALNFSDIVQPGVCPVGQIIVRTWTAVDECGNLTAGTQHITMMAQADIAGDLSICAGQSTTLTASGGMSYAWSPGGGNTPSITVSPVGTTTYTVTATDAGGCTATASATVVLTTGIAFAVTPTSPSCNGATDGSLAVSGVSGGQAPYQYALNNNPLQNSPLFSGLGVGTYTITVQDADGCTAEQQAALPQGPDQPLAIQCPTGLPPLTANSSCRATLGDYTGLALLTGDCDTNVPVVQSPVPGTVVNPGTVAVTLSAGSAGGQSATCVFNVAISGGCGGN